MFIATVCVSFVFLFLVPHWRREGQNRWDSLSVQHESNLEYTYRHWGSLSVFSVKVPPKNDFNQSITQEPKYQAKALTVLTVTIKKTDLTAGAAVVVTIPSLFDLFSPSNVIFFQYADNWQVPLLFLYHTAQFSFKFRWEQIVNTALRIPSLVFISLIK